METLCSIAHASHDGSFVVFDFVVARESVGWFRHGFDASGQYDSVGPCSPEHIRDAIAAESPASFVVELRAAAATLGATASQLLDVAAQTAHDGEVEIADLLARRASLVQRERMRILDEVMDVCEEAWDEAVGQVERAQDADPDALLRALRSVELLWTARVAVRRLISAG
jgi:hypothetical protein